ncbi:rhodanese-like domain-containing protein [Lachnospiraceae bacterium SGI.066]
MGFFDFLKQANINQGIEEYKRTAGAVLLDVRTSQEYQEGHIPESKNVSLQQLNNVVSVVKNTEIPLFVYCYSGARSRQAIGTSLCSLRLLGIATRRINLLISLQAMAF